MRARIIILAMLISTTVFAQRTGDIENFDEQGVNFILISQSASNVKIMVGQNTNKQLVIAGEKQEVLHEALTRLDKLGWKVVSVDNFSWYLLKRREAK